MKELRILEQGLNDLGLELKDFYFREHDGDNIMLKSCSQKFLNYENRKVQFHFIDAENVAKAVVKIGYFNVTIVVAGEMARKVDLAIEYREVYCKECGAPILLDDDDVDEEGNRHFKHEQADDYFCDDMCQDTWEEENLPKESRRDFYCNQARKEREDENERIQ